GGVCGVMAGCAVSAGGFAAVDTAGLVVAVVSTAPAPEAVAPPVDPVKRLPRACPASACAEGTLGQVTAARNAGVRGVAAPASARATVPTMEPLLASIPAAVVTTCA